VTGVAQFGLNSAQNRGRQTTLPNKDNELAARSRHENDGQGYRVEQMKVAAPFENELAAGGDNGRERASLESSTA
jgi:hypothetical protein